MKDSFEIELQNSNTSETGDLAFLPMNFITVGVIENDDLKVYIKQDVYKALEKFAASDTSTELGSIILGDYCGEPGKLHVVISDYIEAKYTDASASTLTFTHDTWDYVHKEHDSSYPDKKIIGWQHTHPNYGIFLSNYDMFIQENFFDLPFQVAYVIDPIQNSRGFFQWKNGKIEKLNGFYIYDETNKPIKIEQKSAEKTDYRKTAQLFKLMTVMVFLLLVSTILLGISVAAINKKYAVQIKTNKEIIDILDFQVGLIGRQDENFSMLQNQLINVTNSVESYEAALQKQEGIIAGLNARAEAVGQEREDLKDGGDREIGGDNQGDGDNGDIQDNRGTGDNAGNEIYLRFRAYTVLPGDTLSSVCEKYSIDYNSNKNVILSINGITDPNEIDEGQTLLLPVI